MSKQPKREPSIHIGEQNLRLILAKVLGKIEDHQVIDILSYARKYQLSNRKLLSTTEKLAQKTNNIYKASLENATLMAKVLYYERRRLKHRGIEMIVPGNKDFTMLKTITKNAIEFHEVFTKTFANGGLEDSFKTYISVGLSLIDKFSLPKLQYAHINIMEYREALYDITHDKNINQTMEAYRLYTQYVIRQVGSLLVDYKKSPKLYRYFVLVAARCKELKVRVEDYIKAQFEGLAWTNGIPEPAQLIGDKADERLQKYLFQNNIQLASKKEENVEAINKLKDLKKLR